MIVIRIFNSNAGDLVVGAEHDLRTNRRPDMRMGSGWQCDKASQRRT
jgi:hypothetical protein